MQVEQLCKDFIYFLERREGREKHKKKIIGVRHKHSWVVSHNPPNVVPGLQPRRVHWLWIK